MITKVKKIHLNLPEGGILVFLTGKQEVNDFCHSLHQEMRHIKTTKAPTEDKILSGEIDPEQIDQFSDEEFEGEEEEPENEEKYKCYDSETYQIFPLYSKLSME